MNEQANELTSGQLYGFAIAAAIVLGIGILFAIVGSVTSYRSGYASAYSKTHVSVTDISEAQVMGRQLAIRNKAEGGAFHFYRMSCVACLIGGLAMGILIQFSWLAFAHENGKDISEFDALLLPGAKYSEAYRLFSKHKNLQQKHSEQISELDRAREIQLRTIEAAFDEQRKRLLAADSLDELAAIKTRDIFQGEIDSMILEKERELKQRKRVFRCKACGQKIAFGPRLAGKTKLCPNKTCQKKVKIPE